MSNIIDVINNSKQQIARIDKTLSDLKTKRIIEETNLKNIAQQENELIETIKSEGVDPNNLSSEIKKSTEELNDIITKLTSIIPADGSIPDNIEELVANLEQQSEQTDENTEEVENNDNN